MSWQFFNPNPESKFVGDCVVRALSFACNQDWDKTYLELATQGYLLKDMPSSNVIWGIYLKHKGFKRYVIPDKLTAMMRSASTDEERESYRKMIDQFTR